MGEKIVVNYVNTQASERASRAGREGRQGNISSLCKSSKSIICLACCLLDGSYLEIGNDRSSISTTLYKRLTMPSHSLSHIIASI